MASLMSIIKMRPLRWLVVIVWTIFISILLVQPEQNPVISTGIPPGPMTFEREMIFTSAHLIAFAMTCALWFWAWFGHLNLPKSLLLAIVSAILIGSITEYLQRFAPDRNSSLFDFLANCVGALTMAYFIWRKQVEIQFYNRTAQG